jgi:hypothetical protein
VSVRLSRLPRWMHHAYAWALRYFWLPCHLCGRHFGGHEWRDIDGRSSSVDVVGLKGVDGIYHTVIRPTAICPSCTREGLGQ